MAMIRGPVADSMKRTETSMPQAPQVPSAEAEALQDPSAEPSDFVNVTKGALKFLKALSTASAAIPPTLLGMAKLHPDQIYLPPGKEIQKVYSVGAELLDAEQLAKKGLTPTSPGVRATFAPKDLSIDYMPEGVDTYEKAKRYMHALVGKWTAGMNAAQIKRLRDDIEPGELQPWLGGKNQK